MPADFHQKRRPAAGGFVVALIGPDGVGKSTQADPADQIFRWNSGVRKPMSNGDGNGWWLRKGVETLVFPHRRRPKSLVQHNSNNSLGRN